MTGPAKKSTSSGPLLWVIVGLLAVAGGGAWYLTRPAPDEPPPPPPITNNGGPVQTGKPLVVKELPFLTTSNRQVNVDIETGAIASQGPANRTSNPFIQVNVPVTQGPATIDTTTTVPQETVEPPTYVPPTNPNPPINIGNGPVVVDNTTPLPPVRSSTGNTETIPPKVLPSDLGNNTFPGTGNNPTSTTKPPKAPALPSPSVVQPGTSSNTFSVPEQQTTVISAPTPILISSLVLPQPKASNPQGTEPPAPRSELLNVSEELQLAFSSVVIGPNSTAVFNSKNGYLMAAAGQKLAGTDIVVKSISQQQVTLQLGEETLELNLDRR
ncbi:hypothetical protein [Deinococcus cellulosilyticus]|uniref:Uncharacterized protein n=1 Tax=Deinococcus cellulosilyticus (strain DSM 18568 / NBRC 106333 / KACC 11606 / 5516J-15) TaxID=1223518 RepID=A0A511N8G8_DEIC1|nr:hypothetical protein [Deinococcus cellulosilyticus]GEM48776.1 hypothetical protein DC3_44110 [Deinococcus cellulosilyticus NBRC 106333 = KACC 11606]